MSVKKLKGSYNLSAYDGRAMHTKIFSARRVAALMMTLALSMPALAKETPLAVIDWPASGTPVVRITFGKFKALPEMGSLHGYVMDTTAENLSARVIPAAHFSVYLFDKEKVRVGEDAIELSNVGPGQTVRFQTTVMTSGRPVSVSILENSGPPKRITLTVNSSPQGAMVKVDGVQGGTTPRLVEVGVGKHILTFSKEGFKTGEFPLEIGRDDVAGGSMTYELGAAAFDSIELRDGSVLNGDLVSVSGMDIEIRVGGSLQHIDRNRIRRIMLVQRDAPIPAVAPATAER